MFRRDASKVARRTCWYLLKYLDWISNDKKLNPGCFESLIFTDKQPEHTKLVP